MLPTHARTLAIALFCSTAVAAQSTTRASVNSAGLQGRGDGFGASVSGDGRYVAFASTADDLVANDTNGVQDVFVHDRHTGATERISVASDGTQADRDCLGAYVSQDGRYVAFRSDASTLVANDTNSTDDVFLHDRATGSTIRVSVDMGGGDADGPSYYGTISADDRYVCFQSLADDLVPGDTNLAFDVFVRDLLLGTTERVSVGSSGAQSGLFESSVDPAISADGRFVAFDSAATNFAANDGNEQPDVFVHDRIAGTTALVSARADGSPAAGSSELPSISADGRFVAFVSSAADLVPGDTNGVRDVYVRDRTTGATTRISVGPHGEQASAQSYLYYAHPAISADGRYVAFESYARELVAEDGNGYQDVFVHDRASGTSELVSVSSSGQQNHHGGSRATISADGTVVVFESPDGHFVAGDTNERSDVFVRERFTVCEPVQAECAGKENSAGSTPSIGASGLPHASGPDAFFVTATGVLAHARGIFVWSTSAAEIPFHGGILCVGGPLVRTPARFSGAAGAYSLHFSQGYMAALALVPGTTVHGQWVSRDAGFAPPDDVGLTDAIRFTICP